MKDYINHPNTRPSLDWSVCPFHFSIISPLTYLILSPSPPSFPPSHLKPTSVVHHSSFPQSLSWVYPCVCNYTYPDIRLALQGFPAWAAMEIYPEEALHSISKVPLVSSYDMPYAPSSTLLTPTMWGFLAINPSGSLPVFQLCCVRLSGLSLLVWDFPDAHRCVWVVSLSFWIILNLLRYESKSYIHNEPSICWKCWSGSIDWIADRWKLSPVHPHSISSTWQVRSS